MLFVKARDICLVIALLLAPAGVHAKQTGPTSSMLTLELGKDSAETREAYADLDLGFNNGMHLRGMLGKSRQQSPEGALETDSRLVGISSDYDATIVGGFDYEYWGDQDVLETHTRRFKLGANTDNWYFQLSYEDRLSRVYTNDTTIFYRGRFIQLPDTYEVDSTGKGLNVSYYGFYPWSVSVAYIRYTYDRDVSVLETHPRLLQAMFSSSTLGMTSGLEAWRRSADLGYNFDWGVIGISGSQSASEVDGSIADNGAVYMVWDLSPDWSLTLTGGRSATDNSADTVSYGRAAVSHRW